MSMVPNGFAAAFRRCFPDLVGRPVLVALSGGADSVALLCILHEVAGELGCEVAAAHVHHHQRGDAADADARHCEALCDRLGVRLAVEHIAPGVPGGVSREAWWRGERYRALEVARERFSCAAVATAHTLDDQAETVLMKLLRGSGPRGVAGVRRRSGTVIRPLLDVARASLRAYLTQRGVAWREDATNADLSLPRGRVRHELLPVLTAAFPAAAAHLAAFAAALDADETCLGDLLRGRGVWPEIGRPVPVAAVAALPPALASRWVLELAGRLPLAEPPSRNQLAAVAAMIAGPGPRAVDLGRRWVLRRRGATLALCPPPLPPFAPRAVTTPSCVTLAGGAVGRLGGVRPAAKGHRASLRAEVADLPLAWRPVAAGERFGGRLVARLLAAAGVPAEWRRAWPALVADGTMIWLPAVGVAEGWAANGADGVAAELEEPWERRDK
ncbi:MAG: tRNA lysidine(34) synthetase TilS [Thermoanaerobaculaceae bacterium]|nr:tRNA lysidine(34) synthetase TilS [Thermoanaerobaculaceae bacterium]